MLPHRPTLLATALLALGVSGCSKPAVPVQAAAEAPFKITVQLDWISEPEHGGLYQAQAKGYFSDAGLDVTLVQGGPNAFVMQKVATGKADIGQSDSTNTLVAIAQGLPLVHIGAVFQNDPSVLMLHADNPVKSFEELDGKTIMARPEWAFLPYLRNKYHIDFSIIPQNFAVANFVANPNFIQQGFYTAEPFYIVKGGAKYPRFLFAWDAGFDAYTALFANRAMGREEPRQGARVHGGVHPRLEGLPGRRSRPRERDDEAGEPEQLATSSWRSAAR